RIATTSFLNLFVATLTVTILAPNIVVAQTCSASGCDSLAGGSCDQSHGYFPTRGSTARGSGSPSADILNAPSAMGIPAAPGSAGSAAQSPLSAGAAGLNGSTAGGGTSSGGAPSGGTPSGGGFGNLSLTSGSSPG